MWFKNLQIYRFTKPFELSPEELSDKLAEDAFQPCGSQDLSRYGWVPPLGKYGTDFVHAANGYIMICSKRQEKILPAGVINEQVDEKAQLIEEQESRKLTRKEKQALKEDITFELMPRALARSALQFAYIAPKDGLLVVNSSSSKRAEEMISALREALGSVPVIPITAKNVPTQNMSHWLLNADAPHQFEFGGECELKELQDEGSIIACRQQNLLSDEINSLIKAGMSVTKLGLSWKERIECVVDDKLGIKKLKFSDLIHEKANNENAEDAVEQFDVDFSIMTLELAGFTNALMAAFGGEDMASYEKALDEKLAKASRDDRLPAGIAEV